MQHHNRTCLIDIEYVLGHESCRQVPLYIGRVEFDQEWNCRVYKQSLS